MNRVRFIYGITGAVFCGISAPISFTAWYTIYEMNVHGAKAEDLKLYDMSTQREQGVMKVLNYLTISGGLIGGILGGKMGNVPKFGFLKLLKVVAASNVAGIGVTMVSTIFASHIINSVELSPKQP